MRDLPHGNRLLTVRQRSPGAMVGIMHPAAEWSAELLRGRKGGTLICVVLPALNEEATVGDIVAQIGEFAGRTGLVDEIVVMDSGSADRTAAVAAAAGATVFHRDDVLPEFGSRPGKGEVLWKSLAVTKGDILVYVDADLTNFGEHYLTGLLGPLLSDPDVMLVKGFYDRPLTGSSSTDTAGGGRVTELMARPLLNSFFPEIAGVVQPLGGEYAGRRALLEQIPFAAGYGVEIAMLIEQGAAARVLTAEGLYDTGDLGEERVHPVPARPGRGHD